MVRGIIIGAVLTLAVLVGGGYYGIERGLMPANADAKPSSLETWAAKTSLRATIAREAPKTPNPVPLDDANLIAGIKLYGQNCIVCHGGARGGPSNIARGLYQHAPQLGKHGVEDDPEGETYWKVAHGIRLTGMPAFGRTLQERQLWQLTLFLKHMDGLPPAAEKAWKALKNPAA
jgi:mono/diheme cytochrome c family protein